MADPFDELDPVFDYDDIPLDGFHLDGDGEWVDEEEPDEDNSVLEHAPGHALPPDPQARAAKMTTPQRMAKVKAVGPLRRTLRQKKIPMRGKDVIAYRRAMTKLGIIPWKKGRVYSPVAGPLFFVLLKRAQRKLRLPADGVLGNATHRGLAKYMDAYAIKQLQDAKIGLTGAELKRQKFRSHCLYLYHNRHRVHYTMSASRMSIVRRNLSFTNMWRSGDLWEDCSSIGKGLFKWIGVPDPNGFGYGNPWGFTGTMTRTGRSVAISHASLQIGDAILTGRYPYVHVWYSIGSANGFSHGKESDPRIVPVFYRPPARVQRYIREG